MKMAGIAAAVVVILTVGGWQLSKHMTSAEPLTEAEAATKVKELYPGEIVDLSKQQDRYLIAIKNDTGIYKVEIDSITGEIASMKQTEEHTPPQPERSEQEPEKTPQPENTPDASEPPNNEPPSKSPANQITQVEAASIALERFGGEIDDIELEQYNGISFYLVEIETGDGREVTVHVNAISGEVDTFTWDD
ncbi:hypothetical protein WQ57_03960 [Mesobacillus campisalis]|uniref:PepSY domain-containing protein n=2 Tax=Mesobacillus campisalis TaxID=1408103 RepID=A0A0M2T3V1_9BACI|nr:hypothetical protein WQ57_03960 [Mesobacillus campisalis]